MSLSIPDFLNDRLLAQYPEADHLRILEGYGAARKTSLRVNTMKADIADVACALEDLGMSAASPSWFSPGIVTDPGSEPLLQKTDMYEEGKIYLQNPSSMIPPVLLDPHPHEDILDMCAAPGSKTTELYMLGDGKASITACEKDRIRADRLRYNLRRQGISRVNVLQQDARKLDPLFRFRKILLDAPCSGTGTIQLSSPKTFSSLSVALIQNSSRLQSELLQKAVRMLSPGGELVYSTCSLLREENEDVVARALKKGGLEVVPHPEIASCLPLLPCAIPGAVLVCPTDVYEGFFAVHLKKV